MSRKLISEKPNKPLLPEKPNKPVLPEEPNKPLLLDPQPNKPLIKGQFKLDIKRRRKKELGHDSCLP